MPEKVVLITGATGRQGGAVTRALVGQGFELRGMTRKPNGDSARQLARLGVEIVEANLDDPETLKRALAGVWGVFSVQNTWEAGVTKEEEQGKRLARLAREAGVQHFVYTSVGSAHQKTGIPHFENKFRVEQEVRALAFPSYVILRPVFFMENLLGDWFLRENQLSAALRPDTGLQMVAVEDIGRVGAQAFVQSAQLNGRAFDLAGDSITMVRAARGLSAVLGRRIEFVPLPIEAVRSQSEDMARMFEWFERVGYSAKIIELDMTFGHMLRFDEWLSRLRVAPERLSA